MPENAVERVNSPLWWFKKLSDRQTKRLTRLNELQAWLDNDPPLPPTSGEWQAAHQAFYKDTRTNVAALAVASVANRLTPLGFRTGASDDENGDAKAAEIWTENHLGIETVDLLTWMLGLSDAYTMIGTPADDSPNVPIITAEDPRAVITAQDPMRRMISRAGMKTMHDPDEGMDYVFIYLPAGAEGADREVSMCFTGKKKSSRGTSWGSNFRFSPKDWTWDNGVKLRTKRIPIVRFENRGGVAEFEPHIAVLNRINRITLHRMTIGELQSFRQRAVEGLPDVYPADYPVAELVGKKIDYEGIFTPGPGALWKLPPGAKFWESQPIDLRPLLEEEKMEYRTASALMGIPVSYFSPDDANGSAEGASLQRETLVFRSEDRQTIVEAGLNSTMSLAFETIGDAQRSKLADIETIWAPIERLSLSEKYSAASQAKAAGENIRTIRREVLKYTPRQMKQAEADDATALLMQPRLTMQVPSERADQTQQPQQITSERADRQQALPAQR